MQKSHFEHLSSAESSTISGLVLILNLRRI